MHRVYKTEGIILRRRHIGEADRLLSILTPKMGKIMLLAKGVRRIHSRRAPHLEVFNLVRLSVFEGRHWGIVTDAEAVETYQRIRSCLETVAYAYRIIEEVDRLCAENEIYDDIYPLLLYTLSQLDHADSFSPYSVADEFTRHMLWNLGYVSRDQLLEGESLRSFLVTLLESNLKSDRFLVKVTER